MQVQVRLLLDQDGRRLAKPLGPVEGGWEFVRRKAEYFFLRDFFGGIELSPPGRLWDPVLIDLDKRTCTLYFRGFQIVDKAARAQEWAIYIGQGVSDKESIENKHPSARSVWDAPSHKPVTA